MPPLAEDNNVMIGATVVTASKCKPVKFQLGFNLHHSWKRIKCQISEGINYYQINIK